jgi:hypothetical protein
VPNPPATKTNTRLKPLPPLTAKSAGFAIVVGALSAVLLAIPLTMAHPLLATILDKTSFNQYLQEHSMGGPALMVWSWQHNDDLSYLDINKVGVAYLVGRFVINGDTFEFDRNFSRIKLPENIYRVAAVRLEVSKLDPAKIEDLAEALSSKIVRIALDNPRKIAAVQIDFDARESDRKFYIQLLHKVRAKLPPDVKLSMTALASWCLGDNWLTAAHLPVDEVVPMLFSLGLGQRQATQILVKDETLSPRLFGGRLAPGLSINESSFFALLGERLHQYKRLYLFSSSGWHLDTFNGALGLLGEAPISPQVSDPVSSKNIDSDSQKNKQSPEVSK